MLVSLASFEMVGNGYQHFFLNYKDTKYYLYIMAKAAKKKVTKLRAKKYEEKVTFDGTFEQMIGISITGAGAKPKKKTTIKTKE